MVPTFASCVNSVMYEANFHFSGKMFTRMGVSTQRPLMAIQELIPKSRERACSSRLLVNGFIVAIQWSQ